jgi:cysteine-rich repeat protein
MFETKVKAAPRLAAQAALFAMACGGHPELGPSTTEHDAGRASATPSLCGNGNLEGSEQCEDGNASSGDGCSADCTWEPVAIACGHQYACALGANGVVKCWGYNVDGQLGIGTTDPRGDQPNELGSRLPAVDLGTRAPVRSISADAAACARFADGSAKCWGSNVDGELGLGDNDNRGDDPNEMGDQLATIQLGTDLRVEALAGGSNGNCAVLTGGRVKCWGRNTYGELGLGDTTTRGEQPGQMGDALPAIDLGSGRTVQSVSVGGAFACALLDDASVKCWGKNSYGQLGQGDLESRGDQPGEMGDALPPVDFGTGRSARALAASTYHVCALLDDSSVKCWGYNGQGQLGIGSGRSRGGEPDQMGDALLPVELGSGRQPVELAGGSEFTCVRFDDGAVKCWGYNDYGQLGLGDTKWRGLAPEELGDNLPMLDLGSGRRARAICADGKSSCALLDDGTMKCWGSNWTGQLGLGNTGLGKLKAHGAEPDQMGDNLPAVDLRF